MYCRIVLLLLFSASAEFGYAQVYAAEEGMEAPVRVPAGADADSDTLAVLNYYASQGYLSAHIESVAADTFRVNKGCRYRIAAFSYSVNSSSGETSGFNYSGYYDAGVIEAHIKEVQNEYISRGYLATRASVASFVPDAEKCEVSIHTVYTTGRPYRSSGIVFAGAAQHSPLFLEKVSGYNDSLLVTEANTLLLQRRLTGSGLFEQVSRAEPLLDDTAVILMYAVEERPLNTFDGVIGYVPDADGKGKLAGSLEAAFGNVFTEGNTFGLMFRRLRPETSRLEIDAAQQWYGSFPAGINAGFAMFQNDTTYQIRTLSLGAQYSPVPGLKLISGVASHTSSSAENTGNESEPDGRKLSINAGFEYTDLSSFEVPLSGIRIRLMYTAAKKDIKPDSVSMFTQQSLDFSGDKYFRINSKSTIKTSLNAFISIADYFTESDLLRLGGTNSIRGYAEEQFLAGKTVWINLEYRYLVNPSSYLFGFGSAGYYQRPRLINESSGMFRQQDYLSAAGFGISYKTRIGRLSFTYAVSPQESFANGKIHFGIKTAL